MGMFDFLGSTDASGQYKINPNFYQILGQLGAGLGKGQSFAEAAGTVASNALRNQSMQEAASGMINNLQVTPKGQPGPDEITTKQTAEGTVTTVKTPSQRQLSTYGTTVPPEAVTSMERGAQSPFWRALLGQ